MATPAQITANRANAQKSTGPRSPEGKSASRFNALKHGIDAASLVIPGEDPAEYDALAAEYSGEFRPQSPSEFFHVETMLRADWQKIRLQRVEADLFRTLLAESPGATLAATQRQIAAFERTWYRAHTELHRARRQSEAAGEQSFDRYLDRLCERPPITELASILFPPSPPSPTPRPSSPCPRQPTPLNRRGRHEQPVPGQPWLLH